jgi:fructan beta-fructosidase
MSQWRELEIDKRYLNLPVDSDAPKRLLRIFDGDQLLHEFEIELAPTGADDAGFWVVLDVKEQLGRRLRLALNGDADSSANEPLLDGVVLADHLQGAEDLYRERYRPQFHFSTRRGWINDPNGLVYHQGEYHLFYQHNPYGTRHNNMHWGHAISPDLVHWQELDEALYPDDLGTMYSGSGVVDHHNTTGFQRGVEPPLVLAYTAAGGRTSRSEGQPFTQCLAYSNDRGRTLTKYEDNPVLGHVAARNRDPKILWHQPTERWVMALYLEGSEYALFTSPDLETWTRTCDVQLPGDGECPDFFELPVDGDRSTTKWVFWGANGTYQLGDFDGRTFTPEGSVQRAFPAGSFHYAAQTWSNIPDEDGRIIQIAWARPRGTAFDLPGMPFNQFMTFPCELSLRTTGDGIHLCTLPVSEIARLRTRHHRWRDLPVPAGTNPLAAIRGELFDIQASLRAGTASRIVFTIRGVEVAYDTGQQELSAGGVTAPLHPDEHGLITLQILIDRTSIEVYGNGGLIYLPLGVLFDDRHLGLGLTAEGGTVHCAALEIHELRSAWTAPTRE